MDHIGYRFLIEDAVGLEGQLQLALFNAEQSGVGPALLETVRAALAAAREARIAVQAIHAEIPRE